MTPTSLDAIALSPRTAAASRSLPNDDEALRAVAKEFEKVFVAQMLKQANLLENNSSFSGGYGEEAFHSFLIDEYAGAMTDSHSFGLAERIYDQLKQKAQADAE